MAPAPPNDFLEQSLVAYSLRAKSSQPLACVNKVLLEHSPDILLRVVCGGFHTTRAELSS